MDIKEATFAEVFEELESRCTGLILVCDTANQDGQGVTRTWYGKTPLPYAEGLLHHGLRGVSIEDEDRLKGLFNEADEREDDAGTTQT